MPRCARGACGSRGSASRSTSTLTAAGTAVARHQSALRESVRRLLGQAEVDVGSRLGVTSNESSEVKRLKSEVERLQEDNEILRWVSIFFGPIRSLSRCGLVLTQGHPDGTWTRSLDSHGARRGLERGVLGSSDVSSRAGGAGCA